MSVFVFIGPSQRRHYDVPPHEAAYLIDLATRIAHDHPPGSVVARYGMGDADLMVIRTDDADSVELF